MIRQARQLIETFTAPDAPTLDTALTNLGWTLDTPPGRSSERWTAGDHFGHRGGSDGMEAFELNLVFHDPEEGADFDALYTRFEDEYDRLAHQVTARLGPASLISMYDDPPLPIDGQFDRASVWSREPWSFMVAFQHEDKEIPLRLSLTVFRPLS
ncbi:hypothetical protein [Actinoplanes utahensis]|uniref:Uncharacterized protein n=1 Tax=Actinoplanes utahensis TaxID=1869 RepID=A0A0A6UUY4_ACTUT|nr:hypothetical protein [Actinoplanes utahensis]KHD78748.1 hypothetical protein MB27_03760 [Actinoplanes utahensis]GIF32108.1 hypothetical protein Aut01nite_50940 [Actinoplanes utahensis]